MWKYFIAVIFLGAVVSILYFAYLHLGGKISGETEQSWDNAKNSISADCVQFTSGVTLNLGRYFAGLLVDLGGGTLDANGVFVPAKNTRYSVINIGASSGTCWVAWIGESSGKGTVEYETMDHKFKKIKVTDFPLQTPPQP